MTQKKTPAETSPTPTSPQKIPTPATKKKYAARTAARVAAFQLLYQDDLNPESADFADTFLQEEIADDAVRSFAKTLLNGTRLYRASIDEALERAATNWAVSRMAATDRNLLRLAVYEIWYIKTPAAVVINEVLELAKMFSTQDSAAFLNGILERIKNSGINHE